MDRSNRHNHGKQKAADQTIGQSKPLRVHFDVEEAASVAMITTSVHHLAPWWFARLALSQGRVLEEEVRLP